MSPRGRAIDGECSLCVRLGSLSYGLVKDDEHANGQNGKFTVGALREYFTSDRSRRGRTALSKTMAQERQDHQSNPNQHSRGSSYALQKMQYAVQIGGIRRDWFQIVEKTRDAMSSRSVRLVGEMSPGFARLGTCPVTGQRGETGRATEIMSVPHPKFANSFV